MKIVDCVVDLECSGVEYCNLFINYLSQTSETVLTQELIDTIRTNIFYDVMAQICSILDISDDGDGKLIDFYEKVHDMPDFKVLGYYDILLQHDVNIFFCDITRNLAFKVYNIVRRYVDLTSLNVKTSLCHTTLNTLTLRVEYTEKDSFTEIIK